MSSDVIKPPRAAARARPYYIRTVCEGTPVLPRARLNQPQGRPQGRAGGVNPAPTIYDGAWQTPFNWLCYSFVKFYKSECCVDLRRNDKWLVVLDLFPSQWLVLLRCLHYTIQLTIRSCFFQERDILWSAVNFRYFIWNAGLPSLNLCRVCEAWLPVAPLL